MSERLLLLSPEAAAASETFIQAHREGLPFAVISLCRWRAPYRDAGGHWVALMPGTLRLLLERLGLHPLERRADQWAQQAVARWLRRQQVCAVLAEYGPLGAGIAPACRIAGLPLVVIFHGFDAYMNSTLERYGQAYRELFNTAAALVVVSEPMRQQLIKLGAPPERIAVNPCGVDPSRFCAAAPADAPPHFLAIGRFVGKKGPLLTLEAFAATHRQVPDSRLTMIGTGPLLADCRQRALELGISDLVQFAGTCSHSRVQAELRQVRAVVQHSLRCPSGDQEGTPVALIEAQMAGVPVVSTRHAGIPAVVEHGRTGLLVDEGDVNAMAEAMIRLARDPQLAAAMGSAAREHALRHHSLDRHINALAATIHRAVQHA